MNSFKGYKLIISAVVTTYLSTGLALTLTETDIEAAMIVLAQPSDRLEVKTLLLKAKGEGLSESDHNRLLDLTKNGLEKLRSHPQPMLSTTSM